MDRIFLLINIFWNKTPMSVENAEKIESAIGHFGEWFRVSGTTWILHSEVNESVIYGAIKPQLTTDDFYIITRFDPSTWAGWAPIAIERWVDSQTQKFIS